MPQAASPPPADLESGDTKEILVDDHRDLPQVQSAPAQNHPSSLGSPSLEGPVGGDSAWPIFSMYSKIAAEEDNKMLERYFKETDGILIFAGLFSAALAASLTVSFQDLRPNSQDTSAFYLKAMYQLLANPNASQAPTSIPSTSATPPTFSPPVYAVWVNAFWFLSLGCSLLSAALALMLQQCAQRYVMAMMATQRPWLTPDQRARVRETLSNHFRGPYICWGIDVMTFYLLSSIVFFCFGGFIYLFNINRAVFFPMGLGGLMTAIAFFVYTAASILKPEMLYYTPITALLFRICLGLWYTVLQASSCIPTLCGTKTWERYHDLRSRYKEGFFEGKLQVVEEAASKGSSKIDHNVLEWTFNHLVEDAALEKFLRDIPGFLDSKLVENTLSDRFRTKFHRALIGFLDHTFSSSNTFAGSVRADRLVICLNAARAALGLDAVLQILDKIFDGRWPAALQSIEVSHALKHWDETGVLSHVRKIVARIVSRVQVGERDDRWVSLVQDEFGIPDHTLQERVASGDGASLTTLIHITRQLLRTDSPWEPDTLRGFSNFDIHNTPPTQQHDFCTTWNEVVHEAQSRGAGSTPDLILKEIHHIHATLHRVRVTSDAVPVVYSRSTAPDHHIPPEPLSYPFCHVVNHHLDSTPDYPDQGSVGDASHALSPLRGVPDATPFPTINPTPSQPVPSKGSSAVAAEISAIPHPTFDDGPALRQAQKTEIPMPSSIRFGSPLTPTPTSTSSPSSGAIYAVLPASKDAIVTRTNFIAPTPGTLSSSSSDTARLSILPQVSTILGQSATLGVGGAYAYSDARDRNLPISHLVHRHPRRSAPSAPSIATNILRCDSEVQNGTS